MPATHTSPPTKSHYLLKTHRRAIVIWLLGCSFFLMDYFVRISPSLMTQELIQHFNINAFTVGSLSAIFFYPYVLLQPFAGALLDRYGPYRSLSLACGICAASALIFSLSGHLSLLFYARFLLGMGCAFSFIGTLKLISNWFPDKYFALLAGITQTFGMLGAIVGVVPLASLYITYGWRIVILSCAIVFAGITILIACIVRNKPTQQTGNLHTQNLIKKPKTELLKGLVLCIKKPQIWLNCLYNGAIYAPVEAFTGLWGVPFLAVMEHTSRVHSAHQIGIVLFGVACGAPLLGYLSNKIKKRLPIIRAAAILGMVTSLEIIYPNHLIAWTLLPQASINSILFLFGVAAGGIIPSYSIALENSHPSQHGAALGLTNMASLGLGALAIPLIGWILDHVGLRTTLATFHPFSLIAYQYALSLLPLSMLLACVCSFFIKETNCSALK